MENKLYVGNLPFSINEEDLKTFFEEAGEVQSVKIITDRETGRSRGFGFVEMSSADEAQGAISQLDGKEFQGRQLKLSIAKEREAGGGGGGGRDSRGPRKPFGGGGGGGRDSRGPRGGGGGRY